jgi:exopolysaccharide biosynthesis polyprenyl glycosylphosphotransferase
MKSEREVAASHVTVERAGDVTVIRDDRGQVPERRALRGFARVAVGKAVTDALSIVVALVAVGLAGATRPSLPELVTWLVLAPLVWLGVFRAFGLYRVLDIEAYEEFGRLIAATTVGVVLVVVVELTSREPARGRLAALWLIALVLEMVTRRLWRWYVRSRRRHGELALRTLVVGAGEDAAHIARATAPSVRGFAPVGFVATSDDRHAIAGLPMMGSLDDLPTLIRDQGIECLFVSAKEVRSEEMLLLSRLARIEGIELRVSTNLPDIHMGRVALHPVDDVMALAVRPAKLTGSQAALKRAFDVLAASAALVVLSPIMGVVALAIRGTSRGPIVFRQERVTKDDRVFTVFKFRTMLTESEQGDRPLIDLTQPFFKMEDDPRLTRVGRFLRSSSLDELPQLWNVVKGDMSLVGPRPLPVEQVRANPELLALRHEVRAGLTGWWQINGRSEVDHEQAVRMDLFYIQNWSLSLDLYILLKTVGVLLAKRGAW